MKKTLDGLQGSGTFLGVLFLCETPQETFGADFLGSLLGKKMVGDLLEAMGKY